MTQDITATDFFCGAGGSSTGLVAAGIRVIGAANHWRLAIDTHNTNHPHTEHYLDDLQQAHPSWYPRTDIAWFSPECTNHSLAKGKRRKGIGQLDLWGDSQVDPSEERSRATMREVVEFTAFHRYEVVIVENVVDIRHWQHYESWLTAMLNLGYEHKVLYINAQFFGVPQSRDRFYAVFWKRGNRAPDLDFRPAAICPAHGTINAVQVFKRADFPWGRYGARRQYVYRCPHCGQDVTPQFRPAADVIDWSITPTRIGDREKPLKEKTIQRILAGLRKFGKWSHVADLAHSHAEHAGKVHNTNSPLPTQTAQQRLSLVQPFIASQHEGRDAVRPVDRELPCITTMNNEHSLVIPPYLIILKNSHSADGKYTLPPLSLDDPLSTVVASASQHALISPPFITSLNHSDVRNVPTGLPMPSVMPHVTPSLVSPPFVLAHYRNAVHASVDQPMPTLVSINHHSLVAPQHDLSDQPVTPEELLPECGFRMLEPHELKLGMSFPETYVVLGNKRDQVKQVGNAVCCNVAKAIAERVVASLS